jgi:hypothetical protein
VLDFQIEISKIMATKKTPKKAAVSSSDDSLENTSASVAKKTARKKTVAKKTVTKLTQSPELGTAPRNPAKKTPVKPSLDMIARAAYLNYRRRVEFGLPGNSQGDWLEAERQLSNQNPS